MLSRRDLDRSAWGEPLLVGRPAGSPRAGAYRSGTPLYVAVPMACGRGVLSSAFSRLPRLWLPPWALLVAGGFGCGRESPLQCGLGGDHRAECSWGLRGSQAASEALRVRQGPRPALVTCPWAGWSVPRDVRLQTLSWGSSGRLVGPGILPTHSGASQPQEKSVSTEALTRSAGAPTRGGAGAPRHPQPNTQAPAA